METPEKTIAENAEQSFGVWIIVLVVCSFFNIFGGAALAAPMSGPFAGVFPAFLLGQLGLVAVWGVFGPGRWFLRWPGMVALAFALIASFALPVFSRGPDPGRELLAAPLILPGLLFAAQIPLFAMRTIRGYRLVPRGAPPDDSGLRGGQFTIMDMFAATTLVAVVFALLETARTLMHGFDRRGFWLDILMACLVLTVASWLILAPTVWAAMRARNRELAILLSAMWTVLGPLVLTAILSSGSHSSGMPGEAVFYMLLYLGTLAATLLCGLWLIRGLGYAMLRPGESAPERPIIIMNLPQSPHEAPAADDAAGDPAVAPTEPPPNAAGDEQDAQHAEEEGNR